MTEIMSVSRRRKCILFVLAVLSLCGVIVTRIPLDGDDSAWQEKRQCYLPIAPGQDDLNKFLPDISKDPRQPRLGRSIFFHETTCSLDYKIALNARQSCAIESAAKANPDRDVFVLFNSPRQMDNASALINAMMVYKNIRLRNVDMWEYAKGTLVEDWINENVLFTSNYVNFHMSDFMRYLSLNKYRGTYVDMDIIVQRNFDTEEVQNYAGAESSDDVAAGIISFDDSHFGRQISDLCLRDFKLNYSGVKWGNNGPGVITRVLETICATSNTTLMTPKRCHGFNVLPPSKCYAIPFRKWEEFFDTKDSKYVLEKLRESLIVHFWNKFSIQRRVRVGDGSAYDVLAKQFCPRVYSVVGEYF